MISNTNFSSQPPPGHLAANWQYRDPIAIPADVKPTPAVLRAIRIKAGLTKAEAAHIIGLNGRSASWHQYELGRYAIPDARWVVFVRALSSGRYPAPCFIGPRRGTRMRDDFEVGRLTTPAKLHQNVDMKACADFAEMRELLRLSAAELARELGTQTHRVYRIEDSGASPSVADMAKCADLAKARLETMEDLAPLTSVSLADIRKIALRISCAEAAKMARIRGNRPGVAWFAIESGKHADEKVITRFRKAAEILVDKDVRSLKTLRQNLET